jgi:asparagine synthase (glutamine-hydrolysing)
LSILDLSPGGAQPMVNPETGAALAFNGEIYNFLELRPELAALGWRFRSRSDTEVVLAALHYWGPAEAFRRFNGMWALAWFDPLTRTVVLSRDRAGEKPLYYASARGGLLFASEIKTILALSRQRFELNDAVVAAYLEQALLEADDGTFFRGIKRIPAAHYALIRLDKPTLGLEFSRYWEPTPPDGELPPLNAFAVQLREVLHDAVRIRLRSDVPVGVLLSGGIDSSAIAWAMHAASGGAVRLLGAVSGDIRFDETPHMRRMAEHLRQPLELVTLDPAPEEALPLLERVTWHNDEPVGSFANVSHYMLMQRAREQGLTVVLSGQGADELLCGYKKYLAFHIRALVAQRRWGTAARTLASFGRNRTVLNQFSFAEARAYMPGLLRRAGPDVRGERLRDVAAIDLGLRGGTVQQRQYLDFTRFSIPALTHFEDRMSMAHSREIRLPFLDPRLIDLLLPAPVEYKLANGWTKYALRLAMKDVLPPQITWRRDKRGFVNPQSEWLKERLRSTVLDLLRPDSLVFQRDLLQRQPLMRLYDLYCAQRNGGPIYFRQIFSPMAVEVWLRTYEQYLC